MATSPNYFNSKSGQKEDEGSLFHKDPHGEYKGDKLHQERDHLDINQNFSGVRTATHGKNLPRGVVPIRGGFQEVTGQGVG